MQYASRNHLTQVLYKSALKVRRLIYCQYEKTFEIAKSKILQ